MQLDILHETTYDYVPPVKTALHMAHLRPADTLSQRLLEHRLEVNPEPSRMREVTDVYGNTRSFFSLEIAHRSLVVRARSRVETRAPAAPACALAWEQVRERLRYHREAHYDPASEFAFASPHVPRDDEFANWARPSFPPQRPLVQAATDLMRRLHAEFRYAPDATDVNTPAREALRRRAGVCQDFAHVMIAGLRSLGLAARYVSGYLLTQPAAGQPRLVGADASHAWVSVYLPAGDGPGQWLDLDPTNDQPADEAYVTLAVGRDFSDVSPIRGVIHGGASHTLTVAVTVTPLEEDTPADTAAAGGDATAAAPAPTIIPDPT